MCFVQRDRIAKQANLVRSMKAVADVRDEFERGILIGNLAGAARTINVSKKSITDNVARQVWRQAEEEAECIRQLEYAAAGPVNAAEVAASIETFLRLYLVAAEEYFAILPLWVMHTYVFEAFDYTPYLCITSPTIRCGKSNLMTALGGLVARPWKSHSTSVAALARKLEVDRCTMILDEADMAFKGPVEYTSALQGILNSGFERSGTYTRCVGEGASLVSKDFSTYCPKAIAAIKRLPDTVMDRAIHVRLHRKGTASIHRFRSKIYKPEAAAIKRQIEIWAERARVDIGSREPRVIDELNDRAWDVCEPLAAIAESIGGNWEARLGAALLKVFGSESAEDDDHGIQLLQDINDLTYEEQIPFADEHKTKIFSVDLVTGLKSIETSPWSDWNGGKGLSTNALGRMLKSFDISPRTIRGGAKVAKGYLLESFEEAWHTYLVSKPVFSGSPPKTQPQGNDNNADSASQGPRSQLPLTVHATPEPLHPLQPNKDESPELSWQPLQGQNVTDGRSASDPQKRRVVTGVTVANLRGWEAQRENEFETGGDDFVEDIL
jgi:hypothetical protein